ncbi:TrmH family RNA methyltransferase [Sciscionella sediminilitoris]|uniref:TrmH family RNA methyltransferase n=1 Tax=Sciscionella sediminilitoris TaxID=1445613 RepID=UPI00068A4160|nr:RNA methyltransferase [Sciscionella sp. SE31]
MAIISSVKDPRIAAVRELSTATARRAANKCVLEGELLIEQAIEAGAALEFVLLAERALDRAPDCPVHEVTPGVLKQALRSQKPVTALAVAELGAQSGEFGELALVAEDIADPGNLGTIVRTACGLGATDIVLTEERADPTSRRALEASRAAVLRASLHRYPDPATALDSLHALGFEIAVTAPAGRTVPALTPLSGGPLAVVLGNETTGVSEAVLERADHVVRIPMATEVESLNVGVATGVALAALRERMLAVSLPRRCAAAVFPEPVRAALAARLGSLGHAAPAEFEALTAAGAGRETPLDETLRAKGWLDDRGLSTEGRAQLLALWPEYTAALRACPRGTDKPGNPT